jgi:hypothetical protein
MAIARVIRKTTRHEANDDVRDLAYWLSRPVAERVAVVERCPLLNSNFKEFIESLHPIAQSNAVDFAVADAHALAACRINCANSFSLKRLLCLGCRPFYY